jgi:hypothetical protein
MRVGRWRKFMTANKFVLKHGELEIEYKVGVTPGIPALAYNNGDSPPESFMQDQITSDETALGTLVSVALVKGYDVGGETFGFFLPQLDVPSGQSEEFRTVGVYKRFSGPDSVPHRPPSWRIIDLHGTAETGIVEL